MKIVTHTPIFVRGIPCAPGVAVEVPDADGAQMIREGFARRFVDRPAAPIIETATAAQPAENAAATPVRKPRR